MNRILPLHRPVVRALAPLFLAALAPALRLSTDLAAASPTPAQAKVTFVDHVLPLIEQHCAKCHNPDKKKGDLDLTSHGGTLKGGGTGPVVVSGQPDASKLIKSLTHAEEPFMPPNKPPIADPEIAVFKRWIAGGLLETSGSKAVAAAKAGPDLTLKVAPDRRPSGPPPMPREFLSGPIRHTSRPGMIRSLAASPWAPLAAVTSEKQILLFTVTNLELAGVVPFPQGQPEVVRFSANGRLLLAAGGHGAKSGLATIWEIESGKKLNTVGQEYDAVLAADLSPDQGKVALGGPDRLVKVYGSGAGDLRHKLKKHTDWVTALAFSPDGEMLASADRNGGLTVWDAESGQELFTTAGHKSAVTALSWRVDSKLLASSSEDGTIKLWETSEGKLSKTWNAHDHVLNVAYSRDGRLVSCGRDGQVIVWDASGAKSKSMPVPGELALRCAWTLDDTAVVAGDFTGQIVVWEAKTGRRLGQADNNPLPLEEQVRLAQQRVDELTSSTRANANAVAFAAARAAFNARQAEFEKARVAAEQATADFRAKAEIVARLKETAAKPGPPADIDAQLAAARARRETARAGQAAAWTTALSVSNQLAAAKASLGPDHGPDPAQALAEARARLQRLQAAAQRPPAAGL